MLLFPLLKLHRQIMQNIYYKFTIHVFITNVQIIKENGNNYLLKGQIKQFIYTVQN